MLNKIKNALYKFMYGRYGVDELSKYLLYTSFILLLPIGFIKNQTVRLIFQLLFWFVAIYVYFRMFSKNIYKRRAENDWFLSKKNYLKQRITQRKQYKYFDCPKCKTHLRVPRGVGKITITCKKCGHEFDGKA